MELAPTLDWRDYVDPARFQGEVDACFRGAWHYVGHVRGLDAPGDQRAVRALHVPVLLVRDGDPADRSLPGELRAFVNACRHRGARLVEDTACARSIRCPYHGWTYGLDGELRAAPRLKQETGLAPAALAGERALHPLRLETWGPMLFVALDDDAPPLLDWLGPIPARVAALGIDVDRLEPRHHASSETACNWKVACENYLECYHCRIAHRGFCEVVDVDDDGYQLETHEHVATQVAPRHDNVQRDGFDGHGRVDHGDFHYVFPNLVSYVPPGLPVLAIGPVVPLAVDRTWRSHEYLALPEVTESELEELLAWDDEVGEEDVALVEAVQAGMHAAPLLERGVLMPESERLVAWFAQQVRDRRDDSGR
jgi:choline monooxygenase